MYLSGQNKLRNSIRIPLRTRQQEADIIPVVESVTKYSITITDPEQIVYEMGTSISTNWEERACLDRCASDIQNMRIEPGELEH